MNLNRMRDPIWQFVGVIVSIAALIIPIGQSNPVWYGIGAIIAAIICYFIFPKFTRRIVNIAIFIFIIFTFFTYPMFSKIRNNVEGLTKSLIYTVSDASNSENTSTFSNALPSSQPIPASSEFATFINTFTPEQMVERYFQHLNAGRYDAAWSMMTTAYQERHNPTGFINYQGYWQQQGRVVTEVIHEVESSDNRRLVEVRIRYPDQDNTSTFRMAVVSDAQNIWMLDEYCEVDGQPRCPSVGIR